MEKYDIDKHEKFNNKEEREHAVNFHKRRIAFMIIDDEVNLLRNSEMSHYEWAKTLEISEEKFNLITRGYVFENRIVFYKGNFDFDEQVILEANKYAEEIKNACNLTTCSVYVGLIVGEKGTIYPPKRHLFDL